MASNPSNFTQNLRSDYVIVIGSHQVKLIDGQNDEWNLAGLSEALYVSRNRGDYETQIRNQHPPAVNIDDSTRFYGSLPVEGLSDVRNALKTLGSNCRGIERVR